MKIEIKGKETILLEYLLELLALNCYLLFITCNLYYLYVVNFLIVKPFYLFYCKLI